MGMKYYIDYDFMNWNKYINADRTNKYIGAKIKREEKEIVRMLCRHIQPITEYPISIIFTKYIRTANNDVDNVRVKSLLDGLVDIGVLQNDNFNCIKSIMIQAAISKTKNGIDIEFIK